MLEEILYTLTKINESDLEKFALILYLSRNRRIWIVGNGGSTATASHLASDLASLGFDVTCLTDNVPRLTALTNDYGWDTVYTKQLEHLKPKDIFISISVHGGGNWSNNLILAAQLAKEKKAETLALTGHDGGHLAKICDFTLIVPSESTPTIEGIHCVLTHLIRQKIEELSKCNK